MRKIEALFEIRDRIYRDQSYSLWYNLVTDDVCLDLNRVIKELRDSLLNNPRFPQR